MATLAERLEEAENALHQLAIGRSVVEVRDANGDMVRYTNGNRLTITAYIQDLKAQIAAEDGTPVNCGPMRFFI